MPEAAGRVSPLIDVGAAMTTAAGESVSGDMYVVAPFPGGVLVAVVDGLGHGQEAARAAHVALEALREGAGAPLAEIFESTHKRLARTRGAVISAAVFDRDAQAMTWLGVGNVEAHLLRAASDPQAARETIFLAGGVVGYRLPPLRPATTPVARGDTLVFATDGVDLAFSRELDPLVPPNELAERIIAHADGTDDALALVVRFGEQA